MPGARTLQDVLGQGAGIRVNRDSLHARSLGGLWVPASGGTTIRDFSGYAKSASISGPTPAVSTVGRVLNYNGTSDYAAVSDAACPAVSNTGAFTVSAWVNFTGTGDGVVLGRGTGVANNLSYALETFQGKVYFAVDADGSPWDVQINTGAFTCNDGAWHLLSGVYSPSSYVGVYVDGIVRASTTTSVPSSIYSTSGHTFDIGRLNYFATLNFLGGIGSVAYHTRAFSDPEVWSLYDPRTRYDLYWVPRRSAPKKAAAAVGGGPAATNVRLIWQAVQRAAVR